MFLIKIPKDYGDHSKIEAPFKDMSLSYEIALDEMVSQPTVLEGDKKFEGTQAIDGLIKELSDYYGVHYNCSCAR